MSPAPMKKFSYYQETVPDPIPFELNGSVFRLQPTISGIQLLQFVAATTQGGAESANAVLGFLKSVVLEEDWEQFLAVAGNPRSGVGPEQLGEIAGWISEQYTERPTESSPSFSPGSPTSGPGLTAVPLSVESTYVPSDPLAL